MALHFPVHIAGWSSWQLVGLITRRSQVRILPPLPIKQEEKQSFSSCFFFCGSNSPRTVGRLAPAARSASTSFLATKSIRERSNASLPDFLIERAVTKLRTHLGGALSLLCRKQIRNLTRRVAKALGLYADAVEER